MTGTNNANYFNGGDTDPTNLLTPVGAFAASPGPYGTYDMGGDVFQWNEAVIGGALAACAAANGSRAPASWPPPSGCRATSRTTIQTISASAWRSTDPGDANGDGQVDVNDLTIVLSHFNQTGCIWSQGSMDGDPTGRVDINDLTIVLSNFGQGTAVGAGNLSAVPEPVRSYWRRPPLPACWDRSLAASASEARVSAIGPRSCARLGSKLRFLDTSSAALQR